MSQTKEIPLNENRKQDKYFVQCPRIRTNFTNYQLLELEREYKSHMYTTRVRRIEIATRLDLPEKQVKIWFQNRRSKKRRQDNEENTIVNEIYHQKYPNEKTTQNQQNQKTPLLPVGVHPMEPQIQYVTITIPSSAVVPQQQQTCLSLHPQQLNEIPIQYTIQECFQGSGYKQHETFPQREQIKQPVQQYDYEQHQQLYPNQPHCKPQTLQTFSAKLHQHLQKQNDEKLRIEPEPGFISANYEKKLELESTELCDLILSIEDRNQLSNIEKDEPLDINEFLKFKKPKQNIFKEEVTKELEDELISEEVKKEPEDEFISEEVNKEPEDELISEEDNKAPEDELISELNAILDKIKDHHLLPDQSSTTGDSVIPFNGNFDVFVFLKSFDEYVEQSTNDSIPY